MTTKWLGAVNGGNREQIERTLNVAGAGSVLMQTFINRIVQQVYIRYLGVQSELMRKPGQGNAGYINRRAPGATGGSWLADTDAVPEETGAYTQASFPYKILSTRGKVTTMLQEIGRSYGDTLAGEIMGKVGDMNNTFESALVIGDVVTDADMFDGLITQIQATSSQIVKNTTAVAGDALSLDRLDEAIDAVKDSSNPGDLVIFASRKGRRQINAALQAQQQFMDRVEIEGGFRVRSYDSIPIVTTTGMPEVLTYNGTKVTAYTGSTTTAILVVNKRYCWIEELTPATVIPLARTDSQFDQFDLRWVGTEILGNQQGASILVGVAAA